MTLALDDRRARGAVPYRVQTWLQAAFASRYMRSTGFVVLAFILYHLAQFTFGAVNPDTFKANLPPYVMAGDYHVLGFIVVRAGTPVLDVHTMVIRSFQNPAVAWFYILAIGLLSLHLLHGADSLFQTFGWRSRRWAGGLRAVVALACAGVFSRQSGDPRGRPERRPPTPPGPRGRERGPALIPAPLPPWPNSTRKFPPARSPTSGAGTRPRSSSSIRPTSGNTR